MRVPVRCHFLREFGKLFFISVIGFSILSNWLEENHFIFSDDILLSILHAYSESLWFRSIQWSWVVIFLLSAVTFFWPHMGDDAYIFFRYAQNIANGHGPIWNVDATPVEGFSSPIWVYWLGFWGQWFDIPTVARLSGAVGMVGALFSIHQLSNRSMWSVCGVLLTMGFHYWGTAGLETAWVIWLTVLCLPLLEDAPKPTTVFYLSLLGVLRPEGLGLVLLLSIWNYQMHRHNWIWLAWMPMVLWLGVRWQVYGDLLPNTYWAKATGDTWFRIQSGWNYAGWLGIPIGLGWIHHSWKIWWFPTVLWLVVLLGGGDWMWHDRLLLPVISVIWVFSARLEGIPKLLLTVPLVQYWMPLSLIGATMSTGVTGQQLPIRLHQEGNLIEISEVMAQEIRQAYPEDSLIAINHAGVLPYFLAEYSFVDMSALNDRHLARLNGNLHEKYDPDYILSLKPDLVVLNSLSDPKSGEGFQDNYWDGESVLFRHPQFSEEYVPIAKSWRRVRFGGGVASIWLFQRRRTLERWNSK